MDLPEGLLIANYESVRQKIVGFISAYMDRAGIDYAVLGLSGGIDSSLVLTLACEAVGPERVIGLMLPIYSAADLDNIRDAVELAEALGIEHQLFEIGPALDSFKSLNLDKVCLGNVAARLRMTTCYAKANMRNGIVLGTGNKSEILTGYFTKYGDAGVDLLPIAELYKVNVWGLADHIGVPKHIIEKTPSAGLWANQTDEGEMGVSYRELDSILFLRFDKKRTTDQIAERGHSPETIDRVMSLVSRSQHKRDPIPRAQI